MQSDTDEPEQMSTEERDRHARIAFGTEPDDG
jgi:hypothetical protein